MAHGAVLQKRSLQRQRHSIYKLSHNVNKRLDRGLQMVLQNRDTTKQLRIVGLVYIAVHGDVHGVLTYAKAVRFISQITDFTFDTMEYVTSIAHGICIIRPNLSRVEIYNRTCKVNAKS